MHFADQRMKIQSKKAKNTFNPRHPTVYNRAEVFKVDIKVAPGTRQVVEYKQNILNYCRYRKQDVQGCSLYYNGYERQVLCFGIELPSAFRAASPVLGRWNCVASL
jgi:hypothetical protein